MRAFWAFFLLFFQVAGLLYAQKEQDVEFYFRRFPQMSDRERLELADRAMAEIRKNVEKVGDMLKRARAAKDFILLNCVTEKLTAIRALYRVAETSYADLKVYLAQKNIEEAAHSFRKILLSWQKIRELTIEAEACIGKTEAAYAGRTRVTVVYEGEEFPVEVVTEPEEVWEGEDVDVTEPPDASPYQ